MISDDELDRRILELAHPTFSRKVFRIVTEIGQSLPEGGEAKYHRVRDRVLALVAEGKMIGERDLTDWKFGEVRRGDPAG